MKKNNSIFLSIALLLALTSIVGCKSPKLNRMGIIGNEISDGSYIQTEGNPIQERFPAGGTEHAGLFEPVLFAYDSSQVAAGERAKIEAVAQHLMQNPSHCIILEGHCDDRGSREYNMALGERRALSVRTYLIGLGIASDRTQTLSYGEENPALPGHDESAWSRNRRGEFVLYY